MTESDQSEEMMADAHSVPKFCPMTVGEDIGTYLMSFEDHMVAYSVDKSKWAALLPPLLTPEVRQVHADLSPEDKRDYDCLKSKILKRFHISRDTYRRKLDGLRKQQSESWATFSCKIGRLHKQWSQEAVTREALANLYEMELLFSHMPPHLAGCVKDKKPGTLEEAASFADTYLYNHGHQQEQQQYRKQSQRLENRDQTKRNFQEQKFQTTGTSQNSKEPAEKGSTSRQRNFRQRNQAMDETKV